MKLKNSPRKSGKNKTKTKNFLKYWRHRRITTALEEYLEKETEATRIRKKKQKAQN
jgi:hypothetical protein